MKHAGAETLRALEPVLDQIRRMPERIEKKPGIFYRKSSAYRHFHEDPAGIHADVKLDGAAFRRMPVSTPKQQATFIKTVRNNRL